jgi:Protein of unknown function (DUF2934)
MAVAQEVDMSRRKKTDSEMGASPEMAGQTTMGNPNRERVALRAYELYLARGAADGQAEDDWYTAERELGNGQPSNPEA